MSSFSIALTRALVGLTQGVALYLLYRASETRGWPATEPLAFAGLLVPAVFVPVMVVAGMGNLRARTLAVWALLAAAVCAGLGVYDIFRDPLDIYGRQPRIAPSPALWACLGLVLFIGHALIVAAEAERKLVASYARHFDVSWKHGVQLALAVSFVGAFWALLFLSAELFRLIGIRYLIELIERPRQAKTSLNPWQTDTFGATAQSRGANIAVVHPRGAALPDTFLRFDWTKEMAGSQLPRCLTATDARCEAVLLDFDGDGSAEVLLLALPERSRVAKAEAFKAGPGETWTWLGSVANVYCSGVREALTSGEVRPVEPRFKDIVAGGVRLSITERPCVR